MAEKKVCVGVYTPTHTFFSEVPLLYPEQLLSDNIFFARLWRVETLQGIKSL